LLLFAIALSSILSEALEILGHFRGRFLGTLLDLIGRTAGLLSRGFLAVTTAGGVSHIATGES